MEKIKGKKNDRKQRRLNESKTMNKHTPGEVFI
jgi:hypothetical protein